MEIYMDEKWKLSKKGSCRSLNSCSGSRRVGAAAAAAAELPAGPFSKGSASVRDHHRRRKTPAATTTSTTRSFSGRCARLVKEQRARFYIMRRCVTMLACWRDYS